MFEKVSTERLRLFSGSSVCGIVPTEAILRSANMQTAVVIMILRSEAGITAFSFFGKMSIKTTTNAPMPTERKSGLKPSDM